MSKAQETEREHCERVTAEEACDWFADTLESERAAVRASLTPKPCRECKQLVVDPHGDMQRSVCQRCEHEDKGAPKDEAAERALAEKEALRLARELQYPDSYVHLAAAFVRLRAAVRAEMQARVDAHLEQRKLQMLEADALRAELATLKAAGAAKDEAAELGHCIGVVCGSDWEHVGVTVLMRERGSVRAECAARIAELEKELREYRRAERAAEIHDATDGGW